MYWYTEYRNVLNWPWWGHRLYLVT